jgi:hypothetical protein
MSEKGLQFLYRYRHLQGEHCKYTSQIFTNSIIYFPSPAKFNDPFDCRVHFQPSIPLDKLRQRYKELMKKFLPHLSPEQRKAKIAYDIEVMNPNDFIEAITNSLQKDVDRLGVLSLSASNRDILLWSHYATGHSGLCLQFLATTHTPFFGRAQPVQYSTGYPIVLPLDSPQKQVESFLLTKAYDWKYEEEWRVIEHDHGPGKQVFPEELLVGVILGARMSPEDRDYVVNLAGRRKSPVQIYQASVSKGSYSLDINLYKP